VRVKKKKSKSTKSNKNKKQNQTKKRKPNKNKQNFFFLEMNSNVLEKMEVHLHHQFVCGMEILDIILILVVFSILHHSQEVSLFFKRKYL